MDQIVNRKYPCLPAVCLFGDHGVMQFTEAGLQLAARGRFQGSLGSPGAQAGKAGKSSPLGWRPVERGPRLGWGGGGAPAPAAGWPGDRAHPANSRVAASTPGGSPACPSSHPPPTQTCSKSNFYSILNAFSLGTTYHLETEESAIPLLLLSMMA